MKQSENVFRAYFPEIFFLWTDRIFKVGLLSLEGQWGLLALNIIPIFFKNNAMKKTKLPLHSAKATYTWHGRYGSEIVEKQIFNFLQKYA